MITQYRRPMGTFLPIGYSLFLAMVGASSLYAQSDGLDSITVPCTVESIYRTDVMSRLDGYVGKVLVDLGDTVKKGDVLIELNAPEILAAALQKEKLVEKALATADAVKAELSSVRARFSAIEARTNLRKSELTRMQGLVRSGVMTRAKQDEAKFAYAAVVSEVESMTADLKAVEARVFAANADVEVARADHEYAISMANYLTIHAPFDGVIMQRNVDPGAYVRPPSGNAPKPLVQLEQIDKVRVVIMVPYSSAGRVRVGNEVILSGFRGQSDLVVQGKITRIAAGFERGSRTMRAEVELDNRPNANGRRTLRSGDYGSATIALSELKTASVGTRVHDDGVWLTFFGKQRATRDIVSTEKTVPDPFESREDVDHVSPLAAAFGIQMPASMAGR